MEKILVKKFKVKILEKIVEVYSILRILLGRIFLGFFSFFAKNGSKSLVFHKNQKTKNLQPKITTQKYLYSTKLFLSKIIGRSRWNAWIFYHQGCVVFSVVSSNSIFSFCRKSEKIHNLIFRLRILVWDKKNLTIWKNNIDNSYFTNYFSIEYLKK